MTVTSASPLSDDRMSNKTTSETNAPDQKIDIDLLIVDDENDFRESACRYLKRIGFRVDEAEDGEEALNIMACLLGLA